MFLNVLDPDLYDYVILCLTITFDLKDFNFDPLGLSVKCEKYLPWFREAPPGFRGESINRC